MKGRMLPDTITQCRLRPRALDEPAHCACVPKYLPVAIGSAATRLLPDRADWPFTDVEGPRVERPRLHKPDQSGLGALAALAEAHFLGKRERASA